jgi:hypothetical protein
MGAEVVAGGAAAARRSKRGRRRRGGMWGIERAGQGGREGVSA